jgi:hypothetical protein
LFPPGEVFKPFLQQLLDLLLLCSSSCSDNDDYGDVFNNLKITVTENLFKKCRELVSYMYE